MTAEREAQAARRKVLVEHLGEEFVRELEKGIDRVMDDVIPKLKEALDRRRGQS